MNVTTQAWLKQLPSWIYKLGAQAWIDRQFPRHIFLETTAQCNLRCSYCPRERRANHMDFNLFKALVDEISQYGSRSISGHLFGEPLLYPYARDAARYIKQGNARHTYLLTTNGTHLNEHIDWIIADKTVDLILWSWRPEAKFTEETKRKLRKWGKFRVRFIEEVTPQEGYLEWAEWPNQESRSLHNYGNNIDLSPWMGSMSKSKAYNGRWPCYHLWLAPAVAWNGNILLCCADPHQKEVLGHFPEMSVHEAWTGEKLKMIRESHLKGQYRGICAGCDVWKQYPDLFFSWQKGTASHGRESTS